MDNPRIVVQVTDKMREEVQRLASSEAQSNAAWVRALIAERLREERNSTQNKKDVQK